MSTMKRRRLLAPLLLLLLCHTPTLTTAQVVVFDNETVRTNDSPCAFEPSITGYSSLGALQTDMDMEAARRLAILNQDLDLNRTTVFLETVEYTLCPNQILESGAALVPVVDGAIITCPENCILTGGGVQVYIEQAANGFTTLSNIQLIGWTHQGFSEAAISVVGDVESNQTTRVKIVSAIFENYDSENVILLQNNSIEMELTGSSFASGTSSASTIRNDGVVLRIDKAIVTSTISVAGALVETRNQGTTVTSGVTLSGTQNEMVAVFFFDLASTGRIGATAIDALGVAYTRVFYWSGVVVTGGSVVEVRDWNAKNGQRLALGMAVTGRNSELTVTRASWFGNTGTFFLDSRPTALLYAENGGTLFANRVQIDANDDLRANYFCNNAATMQLVQNCVLGGESVSVGFVSDDSTISAFFGFVNQTNTVSTFCADPAVGRLTVEVSDCFGGQGEDCQTTCRPLATPNQTTDDRGGICLADIPIITNMPSTMPSDTPSSQPTMSPTTSQLPSLDPTHLASAVPTLSPQPSVAPSVAPSVSMAQSLQPSIVPTRPPTRAPVASPFFSPTPVPTASSSSNTGAIVGIVVGAVGLFVLAGGS